MTDVTVYFDFVSPYAFLALTQLGGFAAEHGVRFRVRPVVYAALLGHHGLVGPAETEAKRRYTFFDASRSAALLGVTLVGPPAHPFRSLEALRAACLFDESGRAPALVAAIGSAAWSAGRDITDVGVLADVVATAGFDATDLAVRIAAPEIKERLKAHTAAAIAQGVFGVPTFVLDDEIFWGHDRMAHLASRIAGRLPNVTAAAEAILARPRGADRPGVAERLSRRE